MEFYFYASMNILLVWGVSIPNRMKFYPARNESRRLLFQVSIPNGMEFYRKELEWNVGIRVSIPNGMEFYSLNSLKSLSL